MDNFTTGQLYTLTFALADYAIKQDDKAAFYSADPKGTALRTMVRDSGGPDLKDECRSEARESARLRIEAIAELRRRGVDIDD